MNENVEVGRSKKPSIASVSPRVCSVVSAQLHVVAAVLELRAVVAEVSAQPRVVAAVLEQPRVVALISVQLRVVVAAVE